MIKTERFLMMQLGKIYLGFNLLKWIGKTMKGYYDKGNKRQPKKVPIQSFGIATGIQKISTL